MPLPPQKILRYFLAFQLFPFIAHIFRWISGRKQYEACFSRKLHSGKDIYSLHSLPSLSQIVPPSPQILSVPTMSAICLSRSIIFGTFVSSSFEKNSLNHKVFEDRKILKKKKKKKNLLITV